MSDIKDLIQHALDQDYNKASEVFGQAMTIKTQEVLDQARIKLAGQIYNGEQTEEEEDEELAAMSDEELDAALEGEEDESEEDAEEEVASEDEENEEE